MGAVGKGSNSGRKEKVRSGARRSMGKEINILEGSETSEVDVDEQVWYEYFANPSQWWDNRLNKRNPKAPDFKHRVSGKALWVDGWYTPKSAKDRLL